jgi:hypothetical protein
MSGRDYLTFAMNNSEHKRLISHYLLLKFWPGEIEMAGIEVGTSDRGVFSGGL